MNILFLYMMKMNKKVKECFFTYIRFTYLFEQYIIMYAFL